MKTPLLSVRLMVYNNEPFIIEALESALNQKTNFDYEIVIGDDFSTDNTLDICKTFEKKHPEKIRVLSRPVGGDYYNRRIKGTHLINFVDIIENSRGKYIALLDGDDFWTDPLKLQKQVEFLERNEDCLFCFHRVDELQNESLMPDELNPSNQSIFYLKDIIKKNFAHTTSVVFRKSNLFPLPEFFKKAMPGDHTLQCLLLKRGGYAYFMENKMAVYRRHSGGVWSSDGGKKFMIERAITKINLYKYLKITDEKTLDTPYYMLADFFAKSGYKKMSLISYYKLLLTHYGWFALFSRNRFYVFHPRTVYMLKKLID